MIIYRHYTALNPVYMITEDGKSLEKVLQIDMRGSEHYTYYVVETQNTVTEFSEIKEYIKTLCRWEKERPELLI